MTTKNTDIIIPIVRDKHEPILIHLTNLLSKRDTASRVHDSMGPGHVATIFAAKRLTESRVSLEARIRSLIKSNNKLIEINAILSDS